MKIKVKLEASRELGYAEFTLEDLNLTKEEWDAMEESERSEAVKNAVYDLNDQPNWEMSEYRVD